MNFQDKLVQKTLYAEHVIMKYLPIEQGYTAQLAEAINYSMLAGGKRLRPILMHEIYKALDGNEKIIEPFMAAIEMIHTHSLIHDDLPALDNDDYRRGKLTTHKKFGEALGILSGDTLLNYAYETMLSTVSLTKKKDYAVKAMSFLAEKTGMQGMLGGQSVDVMNDGRPMDTQLLNYIYAKKTSALIEAAMGTGALLAGRDDIDGIVGAARNIGLAFQIQDDILDITSTTDVLGKPVHSDDKNNKTTYVSIKGIKGAEEEVQRLTSEAIELIKKYGIRDEFLLELVQSLTLRKK